ncbi:Allantoinase [Choanephora cucurbitarum]|uniref:allantoinase n=1 Tax=Choanephora cucurbitarum TaxID=101091 RepID=A0A1C7N3C1_9FUNG|nr:Allantoinase [Choanephora cucurbitarum]
MATSSLQRHYLLVKAPRAILSPEHKETAAEILIDKTTGKIVEVALDGEKCNMIVNEAELEVIQLDQNQLLMPGLVDAHVHLNEPGRTEWEGFETGTKAAAAGGITTVIDMPLNAIPPTTTVDNFEIKLKAAQGQCHVDVGFWGGVVPDNADALPGLIEKGVRGFKCFLIESGVDEFPCVNEAEVRLAMDQMVNSDRVLLFHAEMGQTQEDTRQREEPRTYASFLHSRPQSLETNAIDMIIRLTKEYHENGKPVNTHIVHLSAASAVPAIREAKAAGAPLTVETCFHYLNFTSETIEDGATHYKCCPPIREAFNRELLWDALLDGTIDYVVSDHSPCTANLKKQETGDFSQAWGGIASVQFGLPVLWTEGRKRGVRLQDIVRWLSSVPAKRTNMDHKKGEIRVGNDADLVIWRPESTFDIQVSDVHFKNKLSPYIGKSFYGVVDQTIVRGQTAYDRISTEMFAKIPVGHSLLG